MNPKKGSVYDKFKQIDRGQNKAAYKVLKENCSDVLQWCIFHRNSFGC